VLSRFVGGYILALGISSPSIYLVFRGGVEQEFFCSKVGILCRINCIIGNDQIGKLL